MFERILAWYREWFVDNPLPDYDLPDPHLNAYDHGVGTLKVDGEVRGYSRRTA